MFLVVACLPIKIKSQNHTRSHQKTKLPFKFGAKALLLSVLIGLFDYRKYLHPKVVLAFYSCMIFLFLEFFLVVPNSLVKYLIGLELEPTSDDPYLSTSLQDFWGRRWNLMVSNILRHTVYKPVRSFSATLIGGTWAPLAGVVAAFVVSGLMHELMSIDRWVRDGYRLLAVFPTPRGRWRRREIHR
ncbi:Wax synthase domain [Dillenia turbinata]|uniref:Wax synthase domain n=1 Tax=Dillenia turbinata TaxID=194707 RepID=A0AAN8W866_9MAGN